MSEKENGYTEDDDIGFTTSEVAIPTTFDLGHGYVDPQLVGPFEDPEFLNMTTREDVGAEADQDVLVLSEEDMIEDIARQRLENHRRATEAFFNQFTDTKTALKT